MGWLLLVLAVAGLAVWAMARSRSNSTKTAHSPTSTLAQAPLAATPPARPLVEIEEAAEQFSLVCKVAPRRTDLLEVADPPSSDTRYVVNLQEQTCTCPKFATRAGRPKDHFGRWCKHLVRALRDDGAFESANEWHRAIAEADHEGPLGALLIRRKTSPDVLIAKGDSEEWLNVYARTQRSGERIAEASGPIGRFGWSIPEQRWAWGDGPPGARELRRMLKVVAGLDVSYK